MTSVNPVDVLNRLIVLHNRSLAMYLRYASPTWLRGDEQARQVLQQIGDDHQQTVDRLGEMVVDLDGAVYFGGFSMTFTSYHDLNFAFLLKRLVEGQRKIISTTEECARQLDAFPMARALAEESLGAAKAHLELLEELGSSKPNVVTGA
jgi:hypothetical protein